MARLNFLRDDLRIGLNRSDGNRVEITVDRDGLRRQESIDLGPHGEEWAIPTKVTDLLRMLVSQVQADWPTGNAAHLPESLHLPRLLLQVGDRELAEIPWESAFADVVGPPNSRFAIVRDTTVLARADLVPWTFPLRILHVTRAGAGDIRHPAEAVLARIKREEAEAALQVSSIALERVDEWRPSREWPTAEVIHFDALPALGDPRLLSTAMDAGVGTLGWLSRFTDGAQTRLVVVDCASDTEMRAVRRLAHALVNRGGPALLAIRGGAAEEGHLFELLYEELIHDWPLDWIAWSLTSGTGVDRVALFAGAGREEAIRVSAPGAALVDVAESIREPEAAEVFDRRLHELVEASTLTPPETTRTVPVAEVRKSLDWIRTNWPGLEFDQHETGGFIPSARVLRDVRERTFGVGAAPVRLGRGGVQPRVPPPAEEPARRDKPRTRAGRGGQENERFVNLSLWRDAGRAAPERVPQQGARLVRGELYHLGVQVGGRDATVTTLDAAPLLAETLKLRPEEAGGWVEVAVTGIGFDVVGDPVQEFWVPRDGESDLLRFSVRPRGEEISVLRVCLYHRQNVVQSFRLGAVTVPTRAAPPPDAARESLADALGVSWDRVKNAGWLTRLEYSRAGGPREVLQVPERALSIVVNHQDGEPVITVKGQDHFDVRFPGSLTDKVAAIRGALEEITLPPIKDVPPEHWIYAFGKSGGNAGDDATLKAALIRLAKAGWDLYTQVVPSSSQEGLEPLLETPDRVIQVAHVLIEKVLPWSVIYDREFTPDVLTDAAGNPVEPDACLAALPDEDGGIPEKRCGEHPDCLLRHRNAAGIACPWRFWGFRHAVEIPPQQRDPQKPGPAEAEAVETGRPAVLMAALNTKLKLADPHVQTLNALQTELKAVMQWRRPMVTLGHELKKYLDDPELDLIYLYCHARGGKADPSVTPCLEFVGIGGGEMRFTSGDLTSKKPWPHRPFIILNGCGTVGFSPDALSPFIPILVQDRQASGLLGAEVSVFEGLAGEFAESFLRSFLTGKTAGQALLIARRKLLAQKNPLGLVYTLYANADLTFGPNKARVASGGELV